MATTHPFTCNTCQVAFRGSDLQRTHMQSDWHRYNLKRRVASLPPLTSEIFAEKVLANKASAAATAARASYQKRCEVCDKAYFSQGAYINHLGSQKHKSLVTQRATGSGHDASGEVASMTGSTFSLGDPVDAASTEDGEDDEEAEVAERLSGVTLRQPAQAEEQPQDTEQASEVDDEDEGEEDYVADLKLCLFCNLASADVDSNTLHMGKNHGFFIPERDYLVDLSGLITYLSETIQVLHECLYCHKHTNSSAGAQTHMRDRGHCMMAYSTEDEQLDVGDFYDFRSTYSDEESASDDEATTNVGLGAKRKVVTTVQGVDGDIEVDGSDEEEWESGSDTSSTTIDEQTPSSARRKGTSRAHTATGGAEPVYHDEYELHLPSGRTAGHRSLRQYYRQNLRSYAPGEEERQSRLLTNSHSQGQREDSNVERGRQLVTRAERRDGLIGVSEAKRKEVRVTEKRQEKRAQRAAAQSEWGKNKRANMQKHFRDPLLQ